MLDMFSEDPQMIVATFTNLQTGLIQPVGGDAAANDTEQDDWNPAYKVLRKMPKYYLGQVLVHHASDHKRLNRDMLNNIDKNCSDNIRFLFDLVHQTTPSLAWPAAALDRGVCHEMLTKRASQVGPRMETFLSSGALDPQSGHIAWAQFAAFTINWRGAAIVSLKHISGDVGMAPSHLVLDASWELTDPVYDMQARFIKGTAVVYCWGMFAAGKGPLKWHINGKKPGQNYLEDIVSELCKKKIEAEAEARRMHTGAVHADKSFLEDSAREQREANLKRAREKIQAQKVESKRRKVVKLEAPALVPERTEEE